MSAEKNKKVLVVSENKSYGNLLYCLCISQGLETECVDSLSGALDQERGGSLSHEVVIYDVPLSQETNPNLCNALLAAKGIDETSRIFLTPMSVQCEDCKRFTEGNCMSIKKPFSSKALVSKVKDFIAVAPSSVC